MKENTNKSNACNFLQTDCIAQYLSEIQDSLHVELEAFSTIPVCMEIL